MSNACCSSGLTLISISSLLFDYLKGAATFIRMTRSLAECQSAYGHYTVGLSYKYLYHSTECKREREEGEIERDRREKREIYRER